MKRLVEPRPGGLRTNQLKVECNRRRYIRSMNLELNELQAEVLTRELQGIIQNDRYPLSPRIVALKEILGLMRPEPEREPLPPR